jgi:WD40 repeat protein
VDHCHRPAHCLTPFHGTANGVAFGSGGKVLATAYDDGTVKLWETPLSVDDYQALCSGFGLPAQEEWTRYASGEPFPKAC